MTARNTKKRDTALITGASSGIGEALAECFAKGGCDLVLVARSADKLEALAARLATQYRVRAHVAPTDLMKPHAARALAASLKRKRVRVDILVNDAGINELGPFVNMPGGRSQELIALNVVAATAMLYCFLPPMVRRGHGRILNLCSVASFLPVPTMATYAATKAYLLSLTESVSEEIEGTGVTITALCPGITETHMKKAIERASPGVARLPRLVVADVREVAAEGYEACMRGETIRVPGLVNQMMTLSGRALPKWAVRRIVGFVGRQVR